MQIDIPFEIGDKFYPIELICTRTVTCTKCKGMGGSSWEDEWGGDHFNPCKECGGSSRQTSPGGGEGTITYKIDPIWEPTGEFNLIEVKIHKGGVLLVCDKYDFTLSHLGLVRKSFSVDRCFRSAKEAVAGAKRTNKNMEAARKV